MLSQSQGIIMGHRLLPFPLRIALAYAATVPLALVTFLRLVQSILLPGWSYRSVRSMCEQLKLLRVPEEEETVVRTTAKFVVSVALVRSVVDTLEKDAHRDVTVGMRLS